MPLGERELNRRVNALQAPGELFPERTQHVGLRSVDIHENHELVRWRRDPLEPSCLDEALGHIDAKRLVAGRNPDFIHNDVPLAQVQQEMGQGTSFGLSGRHDDHVLAHLSAPKPFVS